MPRRGSPGEPLVETALGFGGREDLDDDVARLERFGFGLPEAVGLAVAIDAHAEAAGEGGERLAMLLGLPRITRRVPAPLLALPAAALAAMALGRLVPGFHVATIASRYMLDLPQVAAVIVSDRRIISTGYNGTPRGVKNCNEGGCPRCNGFSESGRNLEECLCSHGEENAIVQASYHGIAIRDATLYTTYSPCLMCSKMIINAGIRKVVYNESYPLNDTATAMLAQAGVGRATDRVGPRGVLAASMVLMSGGGLGE